MVHSARPADSQQALRVLKRLLGKAPVLRMMIRRLA
jgi:hypothetical protein